MCQVCNESFDKDERTIEEYNQDVDIANMDAIDDYLKWKNEYDKSGYFIGFMGIKIYEEPPEPKFQSYK